MVVKIKGKLIKNTYSVDKKQHEFVNLSGNTELGYFDKPRLKVEENFMGWYDVCKFEGDFQYNKTVYVSNNLKWSDTNTINISENEEVHIQKEVFRADLGELHLFSDKACELEANRKREEAEKLLKEELKAFNKTMIESNDRMYKYCKLHKLNPEETDCCDLFHILYPNQNYVIINNKMIPKDTNITKVTVSNFGNITDAQLDSKILNLCGTICNTKKEGDSHSEISF